MSCWSYAHINRQLNANSTAAFFAILVTLYFWWQNIKGVQESSEKALRIMQLTTVMVVLLIGWCALHALGARRRICRRRRIPQNMHLGKNALGWLYGSHFAQTCTLLIVFRGLGTFGAGDERRGNAGAGVSRNRASQAAESEEDRAGNFHLQPGVHFAGFVFRGDDYSGFGARAIYGEFDRRTGDASGRDISGCCWRFTFSWWWWAR